METVISHKEPEKKSLVLNGLCLIWPIFDQKNVLSLFIVSKSLWLTVLKDFLLKLEPMSATRILNIFFLPNLVCITKVNRWVQFGLQGVKLFTTLFPTMLTCTTLFLLPFFPILTNICLFFMSICNC